MTLTAQRFFEEIVPKLLEGKQRLPSVTFHVVGEQGGVWTIADGAVTANDDTQAALRITVADVAFEDLMLGAVDAETLLRQGGMVLQGDTRLLAALSFVLEPSHKSWQRR